MGARSPARHPRRYSRRDTPRNRDLVGEVTVGGKVTGLVVGAGHEAEPHALNRRSGRVGRDGAPHRARRLPAQEPVPIGAPRLQANDVGVDRPCIGRFGVGDAAANACRAAQDRSQSRRRPARLRRLPPGVAGLAESGSGASRVHSTKPSGRGAPDATPRLNGSPLGQRRSCATARPITAYATARPRHPAPSAPINRRRSMAKRLAWDGRPDDERKDIGVRLSER